MDTLIVVALFISILCTLAYRANTRFHREDRLPMQWGFTGQVNWSAPRRLALAFIPVVAILVLGFFAYMALNVPPRAGQEGFVFPSLLGIGATFVAVQLLHFWLIEKTLRRNVG